MDPGDMEKWFRWASDDTEGGRVVDYNSRTTHIGRCLLQYRADVPHDSLIETDTSSLTSGPGFLTPCLFLFDSVKNVGECFILSSGYVRCCVWLIA